MPQNKQEKSVIRQLYEASTIGIQLVLATFIGFLMGYGLDKLFKTSPWFTFIFLVLGVIAGFREVFKVAKRQARENERDDQQDK